MDIIHSEGETYTLNFKRGEEVMAGLIAFVTENNIQAAHLTGLGAASKVTVAYYNLDTKEYEKQDIVEDVEILSLVGNVGIKEGGIPVVHIHGTFGRRELNVFGGHIFELLISGAGEIHLTAFSGAINRIFDEETGLTLMCPAPIAEK